MSCTQQNDILSDLNEVSLRGSVSELETLIRRDPLILYKLSLTTFTETSLHISALLGHFDFTKSLLNHKPQLALELDNSKRTPLHLASTEGHTEIVHVLLQTHEDARLKSDQDGRIPLHYAAMRGRTDVATKLIRAKPESLMVLDGSGKTTLHLCVEHNHLETLKTLVQVGDVSGDFLNIRDFHHGNTILHLAVILKQVEVVIWNSEIISTALDMLADAGIKNNEKNQTQALPSTTKSVTSNEKNWRKFFKSSKKFLQHQGKRLEEMRGVLSLVATMISTMTFDAITNVNPPDVITIKETPNGEQYFVNNPPYGEPYFVDNLSNIDKQYYFTHFIMFNSISFVTSLSITLLLVSGVPLKNEVTMGILSTGTDVTLTFLMLSYIYGVFILDTSGLFTGSVFIFLCWIGLLGLIVVFTTIRVIYWLVKVKKHGVEAYN